jgi:hypothetical protein
MHEQIEASPTPTPLIEISQDTPIGQFDTDVLRTRAAWKTLGYCVPTKALPQKIDMYQVPGYTTVFRERHLFAYMQVRPVSEKVKQRRAAAAAKGVSTRVTNMLRAMEEAELTIVRGKTNEEIRDLARMTHGGSYRGDPGEFIWSNRKARNTIRHCLTNYEQQWGRINRGWTGAEAYNILRNRADALVDEAYPQYAAGMPEV